MWFRGGSKKSWWVDEGIEDPPRFFELVRVHLPEATHLGAEGTVISDKAHELYLRYSDPEVDHAPSDVLWPRSDRYTCRCTAAFWAELIVLAGISTSSELLHHLTLHAGERRLVTWHDAFANFLKLDGDIPEATVAIIAGTFGVRYGK